MIERIAKGLALSLLLVLAYAAGGGFQQISAGGPVGCPEDAIVVWDGTAHTVCLSADDLGLDPAWLYRYGQRVAP